MKFRTQYSVRFSSNDERMYNNVGSIYKDNYVLDYDEQGCQCLKCVGKSNIYDEIQSYRDSCDLSIILSRLDPMQVNGMMSTYSLDDLNNSSVVDVTQLPVNAGDMLNLVKRGNELFNGLPLEIRERFNFSANKFISSFGTDEFIDNINELNIMYYGDDAFQLEKPKRGRRKVNKKIVNSNNTETGKKGDE